MNETAALDEIVEQRHIAVCCGTGGVGKTTTAAVLAIEAARRGRNAVVVTIDPAKRLADTLGLDRLTDTPREIDRSIWAGGSGGSADAAQPNGRLSALMLDTKSTFDGLVTRYAVNGEQAQRILDNGFYRNVSGALGGTQEYMAMEKLHELHAEGGYD
ncbi:MAG TPA: ArsA-related P-loop ATPase, partial [Acidimicrobiia bacterium]